MISDFVASLEFLAAHTQAVLPFLGKILLLLFGILVVNAFLGKRLLIFGIMPRQVMGIPGILLAPLLHADFNHFFFNAIPLFVLSDFVLIQGYELYFHLTFWITVISGTLIWCFGHKGIHCGASAVITGYWGWLVMGAYQQGTALSIMLGLVSAYYFGAIFFGIFPSEKGVSWEGHLFGLLAGVGLSYVNVMMLPLPW